MGVTNPSTQCPACLGDDFRSLFRIEAGELPGYPEDAAVYACDDCAHEWDTQHLSYVQHSEVSPAWVDALGDLYATVYAEPPYCEGPDEVRGFRAGLPEEATRPGFALITAHDGDTLVGAAYGWTMERGRWWKRADRQPPADVLDADKLAVLEWLVRPAHRRRGVGAELLRRLLDGRPEPYATLASNPESAARDIYERAGWVQVGESETPWGAHMHLLVLRLGR
ncbi:GNAT family N-acetyltransferase [Micromonospora sp. FIMYZ51]|uniref:GNAT family N-acetyltransferase n=1 Tax=Micromonospora sp. FIMYZ51 TaxID=3051832 RepID=UPI00311D98E1